MKRLIIFILMILAFIFVLPAQDIMEISLEEALRLALDKSIPVAISKEEVRLARYKVQENTGFLPEITLQGSRMLDEKLMTFEMPPMFPGMEPISGTLDFTKDYEFTFQVSQPVFTGGKIWLNFRNAKLDLQIAREKNASSREETILNVKRAFYSVQVLQKLLEAQIEALNLAEESYANIKQSFDLGMVSQFDLLRGEMAVSSVKPEITRTENLLQTTLFSLKMLLRIPQTTTIRLKGELAFEPKQLDQVNLVKAALLNRTEIKQLEMEKEKMANLVRMSWAQFIPDLAVVARYSYRSDFFRFTKNNWEDYYTIALGVNFTLFSGLKRTARIGQAKAAQKILDLNLKQLSDVTIMEVENKVRTIQQEYENILLGQKNLETAKEGARIADLSYKEGLITVLELNSAHTELTRARVNYLQALFNYNMALAELEKLTRENRNGGKQ